jgi:hypothetical protein
MDVLTLYADFKASNDDSVLASKAKVAKLMNCSVSSIDKNMAKGRNIPPYFKVGGKVQFHLMEVAKFLYENRVEIYGKGSQL